MSERTRNDTSTVEMDELCRNDRRAVMNMVVLRWCLDGDQEAAELKPTLPKEDVRARLAEREEEMRKEYLDYMTA